LIWLPSSDEAAPVRGNYLYSTQRAKGEARQALQHVPFFVVNVDLAAALQRVRLLDYEKVIDWIGCNRAARLPFSSLIWNLSLKRLLLRLEVVHLDAVG
jgi:hypothetical protein